jgi:hypothetical protein
MSMLEAVQSRVLTFALPYLMPRALAYAEAQAQHVASYGSPLDPRGLAIAEAIGIEHPERVRRLVVDTMPVPQDRLLRVVAQLFGVLGPQTAGLTLGYNLLTLKGHENDELECAHELVHTRQYEESMAPEDGRVPQGPHVYGHGVDGSLRRFVGGYLEQLVRHGHEDAPLEIDARMRAKLGLQGL